MKLPLVLSFAVMGPLSAAYVADFNTPGQLSSDFTTSQPGPVSQSATGGLSGSGSVNLSGLGGTQEQLFTLNQSFAGNLGSWSASLYYFGNAQNFWAFGIVPQAAPAVLDGTPSQGSTYLPYLYIQSGSAENGAFGIGNYSPTHGEGEFSPLSIVSGGLPTTDAWYKYSMSVTFSGASSYTVQAIMSAAGADGTVGATLATSNVTFSNPELAADPSVNLFFYMYDGKAIDNFATTAVPETNVTLVAAACLLTGALRRRR